MVTVVGTTKVPGRTEGGESDDSRTGRRRIGHTDSPLKLWRGTGTGTVGVCIHFPSYLLSTPRTTPSTRHSRPPSGPGVLREPTTVRVTKSASTWSRRGRSVPMGLTRHVQDTMSTLSRPTVVTLADLDILQNLRTRGERGRYRHLFWYAQRNHQFGGPLESDTTPTLNHGDRRRHPFHRHTCPPDSYLDPTVDTPSRRHGYTGRRPGSPPPVPLSSDVSLG